MSVIAFEIRRLHGHACQFCACEVLRPNLRSFYMLRVVTSLEPYMAVAGIFVIAVDRPSEGCPCVTKLQSSICTARRVAQELSER